jgi:hypothetical protein
VRVRLKTPYVTLAVLAVFFFVMVAIEAAAASGDDGGGTGSEYGIASLDGDGS